MRILTKHSRKKRKVPLEGINWNMRRVDETTVTKEWENVWGQALRVTGGNGSNDYDYETGVYDGGTDGVSLQGLYELVKDMDIDRLILTLNITPTAAFLNGRTLNQYTEDVLDEALTYFKVDHAELGNELFASMDPTVYRTTCESLMTHIRTLPRFDHIKFGAVAVSKASGGDDLLARWNGEVSKSSLADLIEAYIYHLYVKDGTEAEDRIAEYAHYKIPSKKETWITEFGSQYKTTETENAMEYIKLRDFFREDADVITPYTALNFIDTRWSFIDEFGDLTTRGSYYINN